MQESLALLELEKANIARQDGNEGMARVLARRAAGMAIRDYLENKGNNLSELPLNTLIKDIDVRKSLPISIHSSLDRLSTRVGIDFRFPVDFDLLLDTKIVIDQLSMLMER